MHQPGTFAAPCRHSTAPIATAGPPPLLSVIPRQDSAARLRQRPHSASTPSVRSQPHRVPKHCAQLLALELLAARPVAQRHLLRRRRLRTGQSHDRRHRCAGEGSPCGCQGSRPHGAPWHLSKASVTAHRALRRLAPRAPVPAQRCDESPPSAPGVAAPRRLRRPLLPQRS